MRKELKHLIASLVVVATISGSMFAQAPAKAKAAPAAKASVAAASANIPIPDIKYTKFVLKNGLTVLVHEDHRR